MDEKIEIKEINFDYFHDLMHVPFTRYCFSLYGGPVRHIGLWWTYKGLPEVRRRTLCKVGLHRTTTWHEHRPVERTFRACIDCMKEGEEVKSERVEQSEEPRSAD